MIDDTDRKAEKRVNLAHPDSVATGEIVVYGYDVNSLSIQGIEIRRQCGDKSFSLACSHFGNATGVKYHATDELDIKMPLAERAAGSFADNCKSFRQYLIQIFFCSTAESCFKFLSLCRKCL